MNASEQRNSKRLPVKPNFFIVTQQGADAFLCSLKNVSATGMMFELQNEDRLGELSPGDVVEMSVYPEIMEKLIAARRGRVVWLRDRYFGVRLIDPAPASDGPLAL